MKNKILYALTIVMSLSMVQCTDDFAEINTDPLNPSNSSSELLYVGIVRQLPHDRYRDNLLYIHNDHTYQWSQLATSPDDDDMVEVNVRGIESVWNNYYTTLRNMAALDENLTAADNSASPERNVNRRAIYNILYSLITLRTSDLYGNMPYMEAGQGLDGTFRPVYDTQESIYRNSIALLRSASNTISTDSETPNGESYYDFGPSELIFNNDMVKWQKLANTLLLRYALRISNVDETLAREVVSEVLDGNKPLPENDEDVLRFGNDINGIQGRTYWAWEFDDVRMGENLWGKMTEDPNPDGSGIIDPRVHVYFETNEDGEWVPSPQSPDEREEWTGFPYDSERRNNPEGTEFRGNYSGFNYFLVNDNDHGVDYMTSFAEAAFLRAEAYHRGWAAGDAQEWYEAGIRSSIDRWYSQLTSEFYQDGTATPPPPPDAATVDAFVNHPNIVWNETNGMQLIHTQRWVDSFLNTNEAWFLVRRSGEIELLETRYDLTGEVIPLPRRIVYPEDEKNNNVENYQNAVNALPGGDTYFAKSWWDN